MCVLKLKKLGDMLLPFFTMLISEFGASVWKMEAPQTISLAPWASIGGNTVLEF